MTLVTPFEGAGRWIYDDSVHGDLRGHSGRSMDGTGEVDNLATARYGRRPRVARSTDDDDESVDLPADPVAVRW